MKHHKVSGIYSRCQGARQPRLLLLRSLHWCHNCGFFCICWNRGLYNCPSIRYNGLSFHKRFYPFPRCLLLCVCVFCTYLSKILLWVATKKKRSFSPESLWCSSASLILTTAHGQCLFSCLNVVYNVTGLSFFVVFVFVTVVFYSQSILVR